MFLFLNALQHNLYNFVVANSRQIVQCVIVALRLCNLGLQNM